MTRLDWCDLCQLDFVDDLWWWWWGEMLHLFHRDDGDCEY